MDDKLWKEAVKTEYNGIKDHTSERLSDKAIIGARLKNEKCDFTSSFDYVLGIDADRDYDGRVADNTAKISMSLSFIKGIVLSEKLDKMVYLIDGERVEHKLTAETDIFEEKSIDSRVDYDLFLGMYNNTLITGVNIDVIHAGDNLDIESKRLYMDFTAEEIKRIADAKDVIACIDTESSIDANGGTIEFGNGKGSFHIEGIQGFMKRVYHFFVDDTCYTDYVAEYYENKKQTLEAIKENRKAEREKSVKELEELVNRWTRQRNIHLIILAISVVLFIIGVVVEDVDFLVWLSLFAGGYAFIRLALLNGAGESDNDNTQQNE